MFSPDDIPNRPDYADIQTRWYAHWEQQGYFHAEPGDTPEKPNGPFCIVIPPPNVTGALHLGHALNTSLQDIVIRMKRMQGFNALWMPGTDHAGIATQAVVERRLLEEEKQTRHDLGREKLVERIWKWKEQYEKRIIGQLKQIGCSCDWERTRFTLDETCARAVRQTFFDFFQKGLIYRGKRLVNWDTYLQTAVSDDEVENKTVKGHFWHFRYPVVDPQPGEPTHVTIATTRPETMLGDTAVAVHPDPKEALAKLEAELIEKHADASGKEKPDIQSQIDNIRTRQETMLPQLEKLRDMAHDGRMLELPLTGRQIPLITDFWAKPELGSGCVKITPAHDPNDYEVWQRNPEIGAINILNPDGTLNENAGEAYQGLTMSEGRKRVVADLDAAGLLGDVEDRDIELPHSDRSKKPIEPYLADQWFVKMNELAQSAMDAVTDERVKIIPDRYGKSYIDWLSEKRDWPIGRQLWWGHRIPIWTVTLNEEYWKKWSQAHLRNRSSDEAVTATELSKLFWDEHGEHEEQVAIDETSVARQVRICTLTDAADAIMERLANDVDCRKRREPLTQKFGLAAEYVDNVIREDEVLDTWFSSALWPHSTLGWPEKTPELDYWYPTSVLITSRDIITLWVARMVLTGLNNMGPVLGRDAVPFREVYIHPKILDGDGETMSKSKGNGVDPLDVIQKFGADALRFGLAYLTTEQQDVRMPVQFECPHCEARIDQTKKNRVAPRVKCPQCKKEFSTAASELFGTVEDQALPKASVISDRFEVARNFCNKLWNASRFALLQLESYKAAPVADGELEIEDRWILSRLAAATGSVTESLEHYRYAEAARTLYAFAWDDFCDYYIEMAKLRLDDEASRPVAQRVLTYVLDNLLRLLHPMMPFITEEIWSLLGKVAPQRGLSKPLAASQSIMIAKFPEADSARHNEAIEQQMSQFQEILRSVRDIRSKQNIPPREKIEFSVRCDDALTKLLKPLAPYFERLANAKALAWGKDVEAPKLCAKLSAGGAEIYVDLTGFIDVEKEKTRLTKEADKLEKLILAKEKKLTNENFTANAPTDVVEKERESLVDLQSQLGGIRTGLSDLEGM